MTSADPVPSAPSRLQAEWIAYAVAASVARFVPVPLLDDGVRERATRLAVTRTLRHHGRTVDPEVVSVLWTGSSAGRLTRLVRYTAGVPGRVLMFPVRKYVRVIGAVRGVPADLMTVLLLARTVHRRLSAGDLPNGRADAAAAREALLLRRAFDDAVQGMDLHLLQSALGGAVSGGRDLATVALGFATRLVRRGGADTNADITDANQQEMRPSVQRVQAVLARPDVSAELAAFDQKLDALLQRAQQRR